jgi:hypothetical protein
MDALAIDEKDLVLPRCPSQGAEPSRGHSNHDTEFRAELTPSLKELAG